MRSCPTNFTGHFCERIHFPGLLNELETRRYTKFLWLLALLISTFTGWLVFISYKAYRRKRNFMHQRMEETHANLEINNPIFGQDLDEGFPSASDSITSIFSQPSLSASPSFNDDEKRSLLFSAPTSQPSPLTASDSPGPDHVA